MLVDSHCHLDFPDFSKDLDTVIEDARQAGVERIVTICTKVKEFEKIKSITQRFDNIYCSVGTHPNNAEDEVDITLEQLISHTKYSKTIAIGEAGLDYYYDISKSAQSACFSVNINAARHTGLPLIIHSRNADKDMIKTLVEETNKGAFSAVLHCFSSGKELAMKAVELGMYVSFSGILTFKNSHELRDIAAEIPLDRLLVETDAPYLAPTPFRGKRNEPAYVVNTAKVLAEVKGITEPEIWKYTTENFYRLFNKASELEASLEIS